MTSIREQEWTILESEDTSNSVVKGPEDIVGVIVPSTGQMVGTEITFEGSMDGSNFYPVVLDNETLTLIPLATKSIQMLGVECFHGLREVRAVSNDTETGEVVITPIFRRFF